MQMTYGYQIKPENDRLVEFVEATTQTSEGGVTLGIHRVPQVLRRH